MSDREMEQDDPRLVAAARHALHDEELIAAFGVDGDSAEGADRAKVLIDRCVMCRELSEDVVAISSTIRASGTAAAVGAVRPAPRDFRLTATDAVRLRGGNLLQRLAARVSDGIPAFGRPLGASLAMLGVVGLLVGTMALAPLGGPASMPIEGASGGALGPAAGPTFDLTAGNDGLSTPPRDRTAAVPTASIRDDAGKGPASLDDGRPGPASLASLFAGSIALLVIGVTLLFASARRGRAQARRPTRT